MEDITDLAAEIEKNNFMLAALHHKSARKCASEKLKEYNLDDRIIDAWESLGKSIISMYSACRAMDVADKTSGACSLIQRKIKFYMYEQLSEKIRLTNKGKFGRGVAVHEKESAEVNNSLTNQLVGAIHHNFGYKKLKGEFLDKFLSLQSIDVAPEKDSKTKLQEYCQSVGKKLPIYILLEETGPAHLRVFRVKVEALGVQCEGDGTSKRIAALNAAENFIEKYSIRVQCKNKSISANKKIDYILAAKSMPLPNNSYKVRGVVEKLGLPIWSVSLVGLALTHRSYTYAKRNPTLGSNNTVLAFLGASVIEWIAFETVVRSLSMDDLSKAGGIREVVRALVNEYSISDIYEKLLTSDVILIGNGEKNLTQAIKGEFVQALFGVLFLIKEEGVSGAGDLIKDIPVFLDHFVNKTKSMDLSRDEIAPVKSVFQEKCQALGLKVKFTTDAVSHDQQRCATPYITLVSEYLDAALSIQGDAKVSRINEAKSNGILESELARKNKAIFDVALLGEASPVFEIYQEPYLKWVVAHSISLAGNAGEKGETLRVSRLINKNFLGVHLVRDMSFLGFEQFIRSVSGFVDLGVGSNKSGLVKYYGHAGRNLESNKNNSLLNAIADLEVELSAADPLEESNDIRNRSAFKKLISEATIYRLKSGDVTVTTIGEIVEEFKLLRRGEANIIRYADPLAEVFEIDGAHLCLFDVFRTICAQGNAIHIEVDVEDGELCIKIKGLTDVEQGDVLSSTLWSDLKVVLAVTKVVVSEECFKISIGSLVQNEVRKIALEFWWQYHFKDPYEAAANDQIASILHDVKNSILGYCFTSEHARNKSTGRERYLLAADASGHLDKANVALRVAKSLSRETGSATICPVKISVFIKTLISELWSWVPSSVNLIFSPCDSEVEICTDELRLRSLISNLVKNSVEAMAGSGNIYIYRMV
ncbi:putative dsRNA-binding protein [Pseudomonas koreensis]|uniref:putative dsRNA-binding protein n=1 Tax=Pseudomonas koreensis TaxID=198620 RepID=UPI0021C7638B|nr:putative dsRNA-binding protein [Pseudomonas koreensis]MCU0071171.1 putative dsRNA-binding protein [Pseudomonas koreensis]